jgi:hypothetical protein
MDTSLVGTVINFVRVRTGRHRSPHGAHGRVILLASLQVNDHSSRLISVSSVNICTYMCLYVFTWQHGSKSQNWHFK